MCEGETQLLKIGELAALAGVSVKALRVYEKKNIIKPVEIDEETGYRYYSPDQFKLIEALLVFKDMGFSLNDISKILSGRCSSKELESLFDQKIVAQQEIIWKAEAQIKQISEMKKKVTEGDSGEKLKKMTEDERSWYLAKLVQVSEENIRQLLSEVLWL
ncbi:MAG: MerR family transcriptional regulator [Lachnospiraceae bacterium]|nr:MerR family transcriptional regulator [Lachnospiraceae bacterium]